MSSSSRRRIAASRANGKKSRGPVTPEGKARSAANGPIRHGLASTTAKAPAGICFTNEDRAEFQSLYEALAAEYAPATTTEHLSVYEMAVVRWRLHRAWLLESAVIDNQMDLMAEEVEAGYDSIDETTRAALAFRKLADESTSLQLLSRYDTRLARQFDRCLTRLADLRAKREKHKPKEEFPSEPSPGIEHHHGATDDDPQLPLAPERPDRQPTPDEVAAAEHPPECAARGGETRVTPPEPPSAMAGLRSEVRPATSESSTGHPPPLPRAA